MADSFLSQHTTTATNHDMLRHVEMCRACRADLNGRRRVRSALRAAFNGTEELEPPPDFAARLRRHVRHQENGERERPRTIWRRSVVGLAAGLVLAIGVTGALLRHPGDPSADALAHDAIGDHQNCALKYRKVRTPVPLPEAATRFDPDYSVLTTAPPNEVSTPGGLLRVVDRHACAYGDRRFGHVIMQYRGHVVSLLMTTGGAGSTVTAVDPIPHAIGQSTNGLSVVTVTAAGRSILLVGDLGRAELTELSTIIASPLAQRLMSGRARAVESGLHSCRGASMTVSERPSVVKIRPAAAEDAGGIAVAFLESAEHHARLDPGRYWIPSIETVVRRHREAAPPRDGPDARLTLVAELHGEIVGFVEARCERSPDPMHREMVLCHVAEIAVTRRHRSRGIGARLLRAVEDWGRQHGAMFAALEYHVANTRAGRFYQRKGYVIAAMTAIKPL